MSHCSHNFLLSNRIHGLFAGYLKSLALWHKGCCLTPGVLNQLQRQSQSCYLLCSPYKPPILLWKAPLAHQINTTANIVCRDGSSRSLTVHKMAHHVKSLTSTTVHLHLNCQRKTSIAVRSSCHLEHNHHRNHQPSHPCF